MPFLSRFTLADRSWLERLGMPSEVATRKRVLSWVIVFVAYLLTAQIGIYLYRDLGTSPALIWPPVGIALAAVVIEGYWIWTAIAVAALANGLINAGPPFLILGSVIASTMQPLIGGYILRTFRFDAMLGNLKDVFLIIVVGLFTTCINPVLNLFFAVLNNQIFSLERPLPPWGTVWVGGALSALTVAPFLTRWISRKMTPRTPWQQVEITVSLSIVVVLSYIVFATPGNPLFGTSTLLFLVVALFWIAFRVGPRFMTLALLVMTGISLAGVLYGTHAPSATQTTIGQRLINTEIFDLLLAIFFFILVSVEEQRKDLIKSVSQHTRQLEEALEKIRAEERAKNEFIATLAHELRNPLSPIMTGLELLKIGEKDADRLEVLKSAERQSLVMRRLLDELLDVARIARKKFLLQRENITLQSIIERSIQTVEHAMKERGHTFTHTLPATTIWLDADPVRLTQIFTNILFNAIKYTEPGGRISLSTTVDGDTAVVAISDTGIGISSAMMGRVFDAFVQAENGPGTGLGIGLSITKTLTELHGGTIEVQSEGLGHGSTFTVRLPIVAQKVHDSAKKAAPDAIGPMKILIVDDNRDAAGSLGKLLQLRGHTIHIAHTGEDALNNMALVPDAVLLDIGLPDMDGYDIARLMRKEREDVIIIGLSGYGTAEDKRRAFEAEFDEHITKPAGLRDIETALAKRRKK